MKYIHAFEGGLISLVLFVGVILFVPEITTPQNVNLVLTITTFLFAILSGFYISRLNNRYEDITKLLTSEDANLISLYEFSRSFGRKFQQKIGELLDKYYILAFDFMGGEYYGETNKSFQEMYKVVSKIRPGKGERPYDDMYGLLSGAEKDRNTASELINERLTKGHWAILLLLAGVTIFSLFTLMAGEIYSKIIFVILSTSLVMVLFIMRDLENLNLAGNFVATESGQETFDVIGRLRYYNKKNIDNGHFIIPKNLKEYRLGLHEPGEKIKIKIVKLK